MNNEKHYYTTPLLFESDIHEIKNAIVIAQNYYGDKMIDNIKLRGDGHNAIHTSNRNNGYIKGLESLIDSYILSNCGFLIRSTSNLSSFSMFLNLKLECININEIFRNDIREHEFNIYSKI